MGFTITAAGEHGNAHFPSRAYAFLKNKTEWGWIEDGGERRWESRISRSWNPREEHRICFVSRANRARKRGSWSCSPRPSFSKNLYGFLWCWSEKSRPFTPPAVQIGEWLANTNGSGFLSQAISTCCCGCYVASVVSDSVRPHGLQPTRLRRPWDSPGKNTGVGCHFRPMHESEKWNFYPAHSLFTTFYFSATPHLLNCKWTQRQGLGGRVWENLAQSLHLPFLLLLMF